MPPSFLKYLNVLLLLGLPKTSTSTATCYSQTGTPQGSNMIPCNSTANTGACCNVGGGDICTSAGLCLRQGEVPGFIYQDSCTDSNWGPTCPQFCGNSIDKTGSAWNLQQCSESVGPGTWCCRQPGGADCCSSSSLITTDIGTIILATTTVSSPIGSGTTASMTAIFSASGTGNVASQHSPCPSESGKVVGAGVGASLGAAFLASLGVLFWRERTRPKKGTSGGYIAPPYELEQNAGFTKVKGVLAPGDMRSAYQSQPVQELSVMR